MKHEIRIENVGTNTIDSALKRDAVLEDFMRDFVRRLVPLKAFSTVFGGVLLEGTDEVVVPWFDQQSAASTDWNASNGYVMGDTSSGMKKVTVNKRKYQSFRVKSSDLARQPGLNPVVLNQLNAEKLASDVLADILSAVTAAHYSGVGFTGAASTFDLSSVATIKEAAKTWSGRRSLILDSAYDGALLKDGLLIANPNLSGANVVEGAVTPRLMGFDYYECPTIPDNSENLVGMAVHPSAMAIAFAPIVPNVEVAAHTVYSRVTDEQTGISIEFRRWGNPDYDETRITCECNYGYVVANASGLLRIRSAS